MADLPTLPTLYNYGKKLDGFKAFTESAFYFNLKTKSEILNLLPYFFFPLKITDNPVMKSNIRYEFRLCEPLQLKFVVTFNLEHISGILHGVECCLSMLEHVYKWKKFVVTFFLPIG